MSRSELYTPMEPMTEKEKAQWRLPVPPRFMPYLQKHGIYDLFYELAVGLVINRPKDHVQFLKHSLNNAAMSKDRPRIILLAPPFFGVEKLAKQVAAAAGVPFVPILERCYDYIECQGCETTRKPGESLPHYVARVLLTEPLLAGGWLIADYPRTGGEADILRHSGVRPTHVLQLVPSSTEEDTCLFSKDCDFTADDVAAYTEYMRRIRGLREAFASVLKEVDIRGLSLDELTKTCLTAVRMMPSRAATGPYRIVLMGPTGAGCHTQGRMLARRFKLVLVDARTEETRAHMHECPEGSVDVLGHPLNPPTPASLIEIVRERLMKPDCIHKGWVLIGCPRNTEEMKQLDRMDTPPNRVLLLDVPTSECRRRLVLRRFNKYTGSEHHLDTGAVTLRDRNVLGMHPDDVSQRVDARLREYAAALPGLLAYLGDTALVLHAAGLPPDRVFELTSATVLRHSPPAPTRQPQEEPPPTPLPPPSAVSQPPKRPQFDDLYAAGAYVGPGAWTIQRPDLPLGLQLCDMRRLPADDPCMRPSLAARKLSEEIQQSDRPCWRTLADEARIPDKTCKKLFPQYIKPPAECK